MTQPSGNTQQFGKTDDELATMPLTFRDGLFSGQTVLVSGAGRGLGKAIAFQFARLGAKVALCGRDAARLEAVAAALAKLGPDVLAYPMTIRDPEAVTKLFDAVGERFGAIDVLVNNAGGQFPQAAIDFSPKGWNAVIDTNLNGTWYMMQQAARRWRDARRGGRIVNIVAVISRGMPGVAHTCAARAGVIGLSKTVAIEWAPLAIQVNCVAPGPIATEGMNVYSEEARRAIPNTNLMRRFGDVRDIADAVCYLAGPPGDFITGEVLTVDGGNQIWGDQWTIPRPEWFETMK
jgi:citronellol/citronellal dehydrogenase